MKGNVKDRISIKSRYLIVICLLTMSSLLVACNNNKENELTNQIGNDNQTYVYYIDKNETKIINELYNPVGTTKEELVGEYLTQLSTDPSDLTIKKVISDPVIVEKYDFNEDNRLNLYFNTEYNNLSAITEVLCRASIVKTLTQIEGVDYVEFYVGGVPLKGANENPIGRMNSNKFIFDGVEDVYVTIYFSNLKGTKLVDSHLKITYDGNISVEKLILDQLIKGPIEENMLKTIPDGTDYEVKTEDGICYIDFNEKFLNKVTGINDDVIIYSVVNSLAELSTISKVQILIDGTVKNTYNSVTSNDGFFERNLDILEVSK